MKRILRSTHPDTLATMESLTMTCLDLGGNLLPSVQEMMEGVLEQRKGKLGKEQPHILPAICNMGRIRSVKGEHEGAEQIIRPTLVRLLARNNWQKS